MKTVGRASVVAFLLAAASPSVAEIYKWVDDSGKVHFSDRKNHNVKQEVVKVKPSASDWSGFDFRGMRPRLAIIIRAPAGRC